MSEVATTVVTRPDPTTATETLVPDVRCSWCPADLAERRMQEILGEAPLSESQLSRPVRGRLARGADARVRS